MNQPTEKLLSCKEIAQALRRPPTYVSAMKRSGFEMSGNRATLSEAREFLRSNPHPRGNPRKPAETAGKPATLNKGR